MVPDVLCDIHIWAARRPGEHVDVIVRKPLFDDLGCVLRIVVVLEGDIRDL